MKLNTYKLDSIINQFLREPLGLFAAVAAIIVPLLLTWWTTAPSYSAVVFLNGFQRYTQTIDFIGEEFLPFRVNFSVLNDSNRSILIKTIQARVVTGDIPCKADDIGAASPGAENVNPDTPQFWVPRTVAPNGVVTTEVAFLDLMKEWPAPGSKVCMVFEVLRVNGTREISVITVLDENGRPGDFVELF